MKNLLTQYLNFIGPINDNSVRSIMNVCSTLVGTLPQPVPNQIQKPDTIYFCLSSAGGFVDPGITLYNFLRSLPIELVMHNNGSIDSVANVIFLAGSKRYASPHSSFLFHGVTWTFPAGGIEGSIVYRPQLGEIMSTLESGEGLIQNIITERSTLTPDEVKSMFLEGAKKTPEFALSKGIIHDIVDLKIPENSRIYTIPERIPER